MNKKKLNILLIPLAVILWIVIVFKIISFTKPQKVEPFIKELDYNQVGQQDKVDTLKLLLNYPDPFSTTRINQPNAVSKNIESKNLSKNFFEKKVETPLPAISYFGTITSDENLKSSVLLIVNNRTVLLSPNDTIAGCKVMQCWKDSVMLKYDKKTFIVKR